jgi:hypothetical protein
VNPFDREVVARAFLDTLGVAQDTVDMYVLSYYNVDTGADEGDIFVSGNHHVHVDNGVVVQRWLVGTASYGAHEGCIGHSVDLLTGEFVDEYVKTAGAEPDLLTAHQRMSDITVYRKNGDILVIHAMTFLQLPQEVQELLIGFVHKDGIFMYSEKPRGRVVEYRRCDLVVTA